MVPPAEVSLLRTEPWQTWLRGRVRSDSAGSSPGGVVAIREDGRGSAQRFDV